MLDDEMLHYCQQYVAAVIRCAATGTGGSEPVVTGVALTPHPLFGLEALKGHFESEPVPGQGRAVAVTLRDSVLDRPYRRPRSGVPAPHVMAGAAVIRGDGTLAGSIRAILPLLIEQRRATLGDIANLAFMTRRTLQRKLAADGTCLAKLTDEVRANMALALLRDGERSIATIAADLGYASNSSLTHAVRRWTNAPPRAVKGKVR
jgi:AraC-like DNA-binding protein